MGGVQALLWLAERVAGWGRVYVVESLCRVGGLAARPWLLRRGASPGLWKQLRWLRALFAVCAGMDVDARRDLRC